VGDLSIESWLCDHNSENYGLPDGNPFTRIDLPTSQEFIDRGYSYLIMVGSVRDSLEQLWETPDGPGPLNFSITALNPPSNIDPSSAVNIPAMPFSTRLDTRGAAEVWYSFIPTNDGALTVATEGSTYDTELRVFNSSLALVAYDNDGGFNYTSYLSNVSVLKNATYYVVVNGNYQADGWLTLNAGFVPAPANNEFAQALSISAVPYNNTQSTLYSTRASNDPVPTCNTTAGATVWYKITAPAAGSLLVSTAGSSYNTVIAIYTGTAGSLTQRACNDNDGALLTSRIDGLGVAAGTTYYVMVEWGVGSDRHAEVGVNLKIRLPAATVSTTPSSSAAPTAPRTPPAQPLRPTIRPTATGWARPCGIDSRPRCQDNCASPRPDPVWTVVGAYRIAARVWRYRL
jgi:hypothetical protein